MHIALQEVTIMITVCNSSNIPRSVKTMSLIRSLLGQTTELLSQFNIILFTAACLFVTNDSHNVCKLMRPATFRTQSRTHRTLPLCLAGCITITTECGFTPESSRRTSNRFDRLVTGDDSRRRNALALASTD